MSGRALQVTTVPAGVIDEFDLSTITTRDLIFAAVAIVASLFLSQIAKRTLRRVLDELEGMPLQTAELIARIVSRPEIETAWAARDEAMRATNRALDAAGITIAFPQRVIWAGNESPTQPSTGSAKP